MPPTGEALKKLAEELGAGMLTNLAANDARRDEIDEADFRKQAAVEPLDLGGSESVNIPPEPPPAPDKKKLSPPQLPPKKG